MMVIQSSIAQLAHHLHKIPFRTSQLLSNKMEMMLAPFHTTLTVLPHNMTMIRFPTIPMIHQKTTMTIKYSNQHDMMTTMMLIRFPMILMIHQRAVNNDMRMLIIIHQKAFMINNQHNMMTMVMLIHFPMIHMIHKRAINQYNNPQKF